MKKMIDNATEKTTESELDFSFILASSVHDMKNSLGMLLNSLEEIIAEYSEEEVEKNRHFSTLEYEAKRINTDLIQLLSLYRFQHQSQTIRIDEGYIYDTIEDQIARNDMLFKTRGINVIIDCDKDLSWYYDNDLIGSVIHNVLVNGARYANHKMIVSAQTENNFLKITVSDDGNGFPPALINTASLKSDFHSKDNSTQLGLFFAAKIAELHQQSDRNGHIHLENGGALGGGIFGITIP